MTSVVNFVYFMNDLQEEHNQSLHKNLDQLHVGGPSCSLVLKAHIAKWFNTAVSTGNWNTRIDSIIIAFGWGFLSKSCRIDKIQERPTALRLCYAKQLHKTGLVSEN